MARDIPGFVYDEQKGKYFRVQENHRHTQHVALRRASDDSATTNQATTRQPTTAYTREAVEGRKRLRLDPRHSEKDRGLRRWGGLKNKASRGSRRFSQEIELHLRLRTHPQHRPSALVDVDALMKNSYVSNLRSRPLSKPSMIGTSGKFTIDPTTKELFTTTNLFAGRGGEEFCVTPQGPSSIEFSDRKNRDSALDVHSRGSIYDNSSTVPILDSFPLSTVTIVSPGRVMWTTLGDTPPAVLGGSVINESRRYSSVGLGVPWHRWQEQFGEWGTSTVRGFSSLEVYAAAASPTSPHSGHRRPVVLGTSEGVFMDIEGGLSPVKSTRPVPPRNTRHGRPRRAEEERDIRAGQEVVSVGWKDSSVWLAGRRDGQVLLGDLRVPESVVHRLSVGAGGVSHIAGMGRGLDWSIITWGLQNAAVYDLRWCKDITTPTSVTYRTDTNDDDTKSEYPDPTGVEFRNKSSKRRKRPHKAPALESHPLTQPLLPIRIPQQYQQRQYNAGWAYSAAQGIVAAAYPTYLGGSKVALWDVQTGRLLSRSTKLGERMFGDLVRCMQFVDLDDGMLRADTDEPGLDDVNDNDGARSRGVRDEYDDLYRRQGEGPGLESLVVATEGALEVWEV